MKYGMLPFAGLVMAAATWSCTNAPEPPAPAPSATAAPEAPAEDVGSTIVQLEKDWVAAIRSKDTTALDRLLADDFVGFSPTGHAYRKTQAIQDLKDARYIVDKMDLDDASVNVYGTTAVSFTSQEEKSKYAGKDTSGHYYYTDVWVKKDGRWQAVASHGSPYDRPAAREKIQGK